MNLDLCLLLKIYHKGLKCLGIQQERYKTMTGEHLLNKVQRI